MKKSFLSVLFLSAMAHAMADDAPAAAPAPVDPAPAAPEVVTPVQVGNEAPAAPATVTVEVQTAFEGDVKRFVALLHSGEQWVVDNVKAALTHFEGFFVRDEGNSNT